MSGIDLNIKKSEQYDLSDDDILRITDNKTKIFLYSDLENVNDINEILEPYGCCVILYQLEINVGHWVCLIKRNNDIEFFDPYGLEIDTELQYSKYNLRKHNGEVVPHLTALLEKSNYKIKSNKVQLQQFKEHVNTCGRYCALRIRFKDISISKFIDLLTKNKYYNSDFWASALTLLV